MEQKYYPNTYWENLLSKDFSLSSVGFLGLGRAYNKWLYRARKRLFNKIVNRMFSSVNSKAILDIGCGTGFYVSLWAERAVHKLVGFDLTTTSANKLNEKYPRYFFYTTDITESEQPCEGDYFDIITAFDVLFHIVDDRKFENAILNISQFAKKGGYIFITDNFPRHEQNAVYCQKSRTLQHYKDIFNREGIEILEIVPVFYIMNAPVDLQGRNTFATFSFTIVWKIIRKLARSHNLIGNIVGFMIYHLEGVLILFIKDTPTTKLLVARKI